MRAMKALQDRPRATPLGIHGSYRFAEPMKSCDRRDPMTARFYPRILRREALALLARGQEKRVGDWDS